MAEKCRNAYRKRGDVSVHCKAIEGEADWCGKQYMCFQSQRWEANKEVHCEYRDKKPVK